MNELGQKKVILKPFILEETVKISHVKNVIYFYVQRETIVKILSISLKSVCLWKYKPRCRMCELEKTPEIVVLFS